MSDEELANTSDEIDRLIQKARVEARDNLAAISAEVNRLRRQEASRTKPVQEITKTCRMCPIGAWRRFKDRLRKMIS